MPGISVGTLTVNLQAQTSQFTSGLDKAGQQAKNFASNAQSAFNKASNSSGQFGEDVSYSMLKARGSLMIVEEELGIHLPRALNTLVAGIPGIGAAFSAMLPLVGIAAAVAIVAKLVASHAALAASIQRAAIESQNLAIKEDDTTKSMQLANLKLDDQIAKLEGRPNHNQLKEALLEASIAADKLASSFATDFGAMDKKIGESTGFVADFKTLLMSAFTIQSSSVVDQINAVRDANAKLLPQQLAISKAQLALDNAHGESGQIAAERALGVEYSKLLADINALSRATESETGNHTELLTTLVEGAHTATAALKDTELQISNLQKSMQIASIDKTKAAQEPKDKSALNSIDNQKQDSDNLASLLQRDQAAENAANMASIDGAMEASKKKNAIDADSFNQKMALLDKAEGQQQAANDTQYQSDLAASNARMAILKSEGATTLDAQNALGREISELTDKYFKEGDDIAKDSAAKRVAAEQSFVNSVDEVNKKALEDAKKAAEEEGKFTEQMLKVKESGEKEAAEYSYKMGQSTLAEYLAALRSEAAQELADEKAKDDAIYAASAKLAADKLALLNADALANAKYGQQIVKIQQQDNQTMTAGIQNFFNQYNKTTANYAQQTEQVMNTAMSGLTNDLAKMITTGKANWADYVNTLEEDLEKLALNQMLKSLLSLGMGALNSSSFFGGLGGGSLFGSGGVFGGGKAGGGPVAAGSLYTVGESGKEWFIPQVAGTVVPNGSMASRKSSGGSSTVVNQNFNITTPDKDSFLASQDQILGMSQAAAFRAARRNN